MFWAYVSFHQIKRCFYKLTLFENVFKITTTLNSVQSSNIISNKKQQENQETLFFIYITKGFNCNQELWKLLWLELDFGKKDSTLQYSLLILLPHSIMLRITKSSCRTRSYLLQKQSKYEVLTVLTTLPLTWLNVLQCKVIYSSTKPGKFREKREIDFIQKPGTHF